MTGITKAYSSNIDRVFETELGSKRTISVKTSYMWIFHMLNGKLTHAEMRKKLQKFSERKQDFWKETCSNETSNYTVYTYYTFGSVAYYLICQTSSYFCCGFIESLFPLTTLHVWYKK